ncbi:MAG: threonine ammonia-lyase [Thermoprotei archaeon]|nr:MAG: threonine ammonia-lyase [Thermoprotei archaeon]
MLKIDGENLTAHSTIESIWRCIKEAKEVLSQVIHRTPLIRSATFSSMTGGDVFLKLENLQKTGSFKIRGAYYKLWKLIKERNLKCCVAASSGNHAQGVAYAASLLGIKSIIVMPEYTPVAKINATMGYGAKVVLYGSTYDEAYRKALEICKEEDAVFIHPFDDPDIIAGQGTIGIEIYEDLRNVDVVLVPVGGGGLISGIAIALKKINPDVKIIGVQAKGAPAMTLSFKKGYMVKYDNPYTIADAIIVKRPGELTFSIVKELVDDMILVDDFDISRAIFLLLERCKLVAEPAGALGLAAILSGKVDIKGKKAVAVISGGNIDMALLAKIIEKILFKERREVRIRGTLPDRPGMLKKVLEVLAEVKANIVTIEHDRFNPNLEPGMAEVTITIEVPSVGGLDEILAKLKRIGYEFKLV